MRSNSDYKVNNLHWHDGRTCHGYPTLQECIDNAIKREWIGKILEQSDYYPNITSEVKCYSLITHYFDTWAKLGVFVAEVKQEFKVIIKETL